MANPVDKFNLRQCLLVWTRCSRLLIPSDRMRLATDLLFACEEVVRDGASVSQEHDPLRMNNRLVRLLRELAENFGVEHDGDWQESRVHAAKHTVFLAMSVLQQRSARSADLEETKSVLSRVADDDAREIIAEAVALE